MVFLLFSKEFFSLFSQDFMWIAWHVIWLVWVCFIISHCALFAVFSCSWCLAMVNTILLHFVGVFIPESTHNRGLRCSWCWCWLASPLPPRGGGDRAEAMRGGRGKLEEKGSLGLGLGFGFKLEPKPKVADGRPSCSLC